MAFEKHVVDCLEIQERIDAVHTQARMTNPKRIADLGYANPYDGPDEVVLQAISAALAEERSLGMQYTPYGGLTVTRRRVARMLSGAEVTDEALKVLEQVTAGSGAGVKFESTRYDLGAERYLTTGEVLVSITALEFFYTQAPRKMKSAIMAIKMLAVSVGNLFTALVNVFIQNDDGTTKLEGVSYYLFFFGVMSCTAILFIFVARSYQEKTYLQESS